MVPANFISFKRMRSSKLSVTGIAALILFFSAGCTESEQCIENAILNDPDSYFYTDLSQYPSNKSHLPVGVFDSGTGGLAVLNDIVEYRCYDYNDGERVFENESFVYLADMANMPYGSYAMEGNTELLQEHILKNVQFLIDRKYYQRSADTVYMSDKSPVKAIVIACNTATAYGQERIAGFLQKAGLDIVLLGVIDAATTGAVNALMDSGSGSLAVLATDGTVRSGAYVSSLEKKLEDAGRDGRIMIFQQAGIGIAESIDGKRNFIDRAAARPRETYMGPSETREGVLKIDMSVIGRYHFSMDEGEMLFEGDIKSPRNLQINSVDNYVAFHLVSLMEQIRNSPGAGPLNAIILGCTHYPFVAGTFEKYLLLLRDYRENGEYIYREHMAEDIALINPAFKVARELYNTLSEMDLTTGNNYGDSEFYISVPNILNNQVELINDLNFTYEYKYGRKPGEIQEYVRRVPFSRSYIADDILVRLQYQVPAVYEMIVYFNRSNKKTGYMTDQDRITKQPTYPAAF